jgi:uncharacterized protein YoxC
MTDIDIDTYLNYKKPYKYAGTLDTLTNQLPGILEDFKRSYFFHNKNSQNEEYHQTYENVKGQLNTFNSEVFALSNDINVNTDKLNEQLHKLNHLIEEEREKNRKLKKKLKKVDNTGSAANQLIDDYKKIYEINYTKNWALFCSTIIAGFTIYKVYTNKI